jgi:hypothetical protein
MPKSNKKKAKAAAAAANANKTDNGCVITVCTDVV